MVKIAGKEEDVAGKTLLEYLVEANYDPKQVAVEKGGEIVPKAKFGELILQDGDALEIVCFVGGG